MTKPTTLPFTPLNPPSQHSSTPVLYYNPNAPIDDIYSCAIARINAIINLCEHLRQPNTPANAINALACVSTILLSDAHILLEELNPIALQLRLDNHP